MNDSSSVTGDDKLNDNDSESAVTELSFTESGEAIDYSSEFVNLTAWLLEQFGKKGPEATDTVAAFFTIMVAINPTLLSSAIQSGSYAGLMYVEALANVVEAKRLWDLEDHNVATNNLKIAIHVFDAVQIAFFAYNPLLTLATAPASFTLSVFCEILLTSIECLHAMNQKDFSRWFDDQINALNYFDEKIKVVEQQLKSEALSEEQKAFNENEHIRLSYKRNDIYFGIEARRRAYLEKPKLEEVAEPTESTAFIEPTNSTEPTKSTKLTLEEKLTAFTCEYFIKTTGFSQWLKKASKELNNVDNFLAVLANKNCSRIGCVDATVTPKEIPIGTLFIKVNQDDESKLIVYWSQNNELVKKIIDKPDFFAELPTPNNESTDSDLCARLTLCSDYSHGVASERIEQLVTRRNHLLLDIERRCDSYKRQNLSANADTFSGVFKIRNPFAINYATGNKIIAAPSAKKINFNKEISTINLAANASDIERDKVIQARAEALYQLQVDRFWIEVATGTLMTLLVLSATGISLACPVAAPAVGFIAVMGCYYLYKASQKYCLDREQNIPPMLRCEEPLASVSSYLPNVSSYLPSLPKFSKVTRDSAPN